MEQKLKFFKKDIYVYAIVDWDFFSGTRKSTDIICHEVLQAIYAGVRFFQFRAKSLSSVEFFDEALKIREVCEKYGVKFIVNDDVDVAVKSRASGVHLGQSDMPLEDARKIMGGDKIIGVSVQTVEQALAAEKYGADYLGVGAIFKTSSKNDAVTVDLETLKQICSVVKLPVVAIGGITLENVFKLCGIKIAGIAVISAIFSRDDVFRVSSEFLEVMKLIVG